MNEMKVPFDQGLVSSRDAADLTQGELTVATGVYYKPGDTGRVHVLMTRGTFADTSSAAKIKGLALCQFDSGGTDRLLAYAGTSLYTATPGSTGTFSSFVTGLSASGTQLSSCHYDDRWYLATGYDELKVVENDGTVRAAGMKNPVAQPVVVAITSSGTDYRPDTPGSPTWLLTANARDSDTATFAYASRSSAGSTTETWDFPANGSQTGTLSVKWRITGAQVGQGGSENFGITGTTTSSYKVTAILQYSTDGTNYLPLMSRTLTSYMTQVATAQVALTAVTMDNLKLRATLTYVSGSRLATMQVYDIKFTTNATATPFTPTTGFYYAYTEYDATRGHESAPSPISPLISTASMRAVTVTLPGSADVQNTRTTHFRIYRTYDGGAAPNTLGRVGEIAPTATSTVFTDDFTQWVAAAQPLPLIRMQEVSSNREGTLLFTLDNDPPKLANINYFKGSIVATSVEYPRALRYSEAGYPESWPETNVVEKFPMPERDELVATVTVGDTLLIAAKGLMFTLNDLPRVIDGQFNAAEATPLRGQPGCVGMYAITSFSVAGEARAAWVSPYGIHETNGINSRRLTNDLDWNATVSTANLSSAVLHWNPYTLTLKFCYDSDGGGTNDSVLLLHMAPEHQKSNGPKITKVSGALNCLVSGQVSAVYRQYGGHVSNGIVYLEESTGAEAVTLTTGRIYGPSRFWSIYRGNLRHTAMAAQTATVAWSMSDDANAEALTVSQSVALDNAQGTEFWVGRLGEYGQVTITYSGSVAGAFHDMRAQTLPAGISGRIAV